jgi:anti-sigma regulatory factor (Ser/Thr protein kinase)
VKLKLELEGHPDSVGRARHALGDLAGSLSERRLDDVRLLVSELVTNAIRHADTGPDATISLLVDVTDGRLRVEVQDGGRGFEPSAPDPDPARSGGWGLYLVEQLADRWGVDGAGGTRVWFEMA